MRKTCQTSREDTDVLNQVVVSSPSLTIMCPEDQSDQSDLHIVEMEANLANSLTLA